MLYSTEYYISTQRHPYGFLLIGGRREGAIVVTPSAFQDTAAVTILRLHRLLVKEVLFNENPSVLCEIPVRFDLSSYTATC